MTFHEIRFPTAIARGASGGPERRTEIVALGSGHEERNTRWAHSRRRYEAGYGVHSLEDIHDVIRFFEARRGRLHGFRWKDHADFRSSGPTVAPASSDQVIGTGDGTTTAFQLIKSYVSGANPYVRDIKKPVGGSVIIAVDGIEASQGSAYTLDDATGIVTFLPGQEPSAGAQVSAGYEFDIPVRFDADFLEINLVAFNAGDIPSIPIVELRL